MSWLNHTFISNQPHNLYYTEKIKRANSVISDSFSFFSKAKSKVGIITYLHPLQPLISSPCKRQSIAKLSAHLPIPLKPPRYPLKQSASGYHNISPSSSSPQNQAAQMSINHKPRPTPPNSPQTQPLAHQYPPTLA